MKTHGPHRRGSAAWIRAIAAALAVVTVCAGGTYLFAPEILPGADPVQHALGLNGYDLFLHTPHPPGAPVYHALLRGAGLAFPEPGAAPVAVGGLLIAAAVLAGWAFSRAVNAKTGLGGPPVLTALLIGVTPALWLDGAHGGSAGGDAALAALTALFAFRAMTRRNAMDACLSAVALGALLGFRQNVNLASFVLVPAWIWALSHLPLRRALAAAGVLAAACLAWMIPAIAASGGFMEWWRPILDHALRVNAEGVAAQPTPGAAVALVKFGAKQAGLWLALMWIPMLFALGRHALNPRSRRMPVFWFSALWLVPAAPAALIAPYHIGEYYGVLLPAVAWWSAEGLVSIGKMFGSMAERVRLFPGLGGALMERSWIGAVSMAVIAVNGALTLGAVSNAGDVEAERFAAIMPFIENDFDPETTLIVGGWMSQRYSRLYLPEYASLHLPILEDVDHGYAARLYANGRETPIPGPNGAVETDGRRVKTVILTKLFPHEDVAGSLQVRDHRGLFRYIQAEDGELAVGFTAEKLTVESIPAKSASVAGLTGGES